jgi:hypothetical protein
VNVAHNGLAEHGRRPVSDQTAISVAEAEYLGDAVMLRQLENEAADHVVQPRAQAAAGHDADPGVGGLEVEAFARPARFERRQVADRATPGDRHPDGVVE